MKALVTGGAGYIGAHMVHLLRQHGIEVAVLDDFSTGHRNVIPEGVELIEQDLTKPESVLKIRAFKPDVIFHFAAKSIVEESMHAPWSYLSQNLRMTMHAIEGLENDSLFIFSSSCAVYGVPASIPIDEQTPCQPLSAYGKSKHVGEALLEAACKERGLRAICMRYFNVAGCGDPVLLENHHPETHLIPNLLLAAGKNTFSMYGTDHPTTDGTAVRDYIDVRDLTEAHLLASQQLRQQKAGFFQAFNLGSGSGYSVKQVFDTVEQLTGCTIDYNTHPARPGDAPTLIANCTAWKTFSGWRAKYDIHAMIESAWKAMHA
ncbi:UDP-glucose 4-epimerase GalE [Mariprofundus sp. EBB-1]|uniref:UDP-glucose 4-epimerase GalE n=1 Tax=Mariprofundus sp. EBB-1 TaxID=2650971 RepID=UPI000EF20A80|nr:UDP-glucose 4-epimerase GalE [Mariprofundus sp. EBB-1]RLL50918.1 UDP-glucose 4-epimerase GalE [Mariprofundus sp. EBB-1]